MGKRGIEKHRRRGAGLRGRGEVGKGDGGEAGGRLKRGRDLRSARRGKINKFYLNK